MANLANLLGQTTFVKVSHLSLDYSDLNKEGFVDDISMMAVPINIQPASPYITAMNGGAYGKSFIGFTTASGILETDRLTTVSGMITKQYIVKGKMDYDYELSQHLELYIELIQ